MKQLGHEVGSHEGPPPVAPLPPAPESAVVPPAPESAEPRTPESVSAPPVPPPLLAPPPLELPPLLGPPPLELPPPAFPGGVASAPLEPPASSLPPAPPGARPTLATYFSSMPRMLVHAASSITPPISAVVAFWGRIGCVCDRSAAPGRESTDLGIIAPRQTALQEPLENSARAARQCSRESTCS